MLIDKVYGIPHELGSLVKNEIQKDYRVGTKFMMSRIAVLLPDIDIDYVLVRQCINGFNHPGGVSRNDHTVGYIFDNHRPCSNDGIFPNYDPG